MAPLSAADLQRRHELEGAPDPFPSFPRDQRMPLSEPVLRSNVDTDSETAFPSLAAVAPVKPPTSITAWGTGPRVQSPISPRPSGVQTLTLPSIDLSQVASKGKIPTLIEYQKTVGAKFRVQVTSVQQRTTGQTTFTIKADSEKDIAKARKHIIVTLSPTVSLKVDAPNSTIPSIIGPGGSTIRNIRDKTNARIDIPRRDDADIQINGGTTPTESDDDDEPTTTITITAPQPLAYEARSLVEEIISAKKSKLTQRIRDVPPHILPFILPRKATFLSAAEGLGEINISLDRATNTIIANGDREAVKTVADKITEVINGLKGSLTPLKMGLPKKQHRLLTPAVVAEIMAKTRCSVTVPPPEDPSDEISVWGNITQGTDISSGLQAVIAKVNSQYAQEYTLPPDLGRTTLSYIHKTGYLKALQSQHPKVSFYFPSNHQLLSDRPLVIDLVGEKDLVVAAHRTLGDLVVSLAEGAREVEVDHLRHRVIQTKLGKRLKQLSDSHKIIFVFPDPMEESSLVLLLFDPVAAEYSGSKVEHLDLAQAELLKLAKECGEFKTQTIHVDQRWHDSVLGKDGTTLNAIIGDDRTLFVKFGADAAALADSQDENVIYVRGAVADVDTAVKEIHRIVEAARNDEIDNSYTIEFEINREYVGRVVGSGGSAVNKLREQLGVKLDFVDEADDKERDAPKRKKAAALVDAKATVKIRGRRENVEEAKRRIMNQVDRLADETSEVLKIPHQYHYSLIGASGKYVIRLQDKYAVKITFPRDGGEGDVRARENVKADEVLVKGGKKGVAGAKSELLEALEFEKESNNTLEFTVPTKAVARILGRGWVNINQIKDDTGAQIDIDKGLNDQTKITLRGTAEAITAAKAAILVISDQIGDEVSETVTIDTKHHRAIIGAGGQGLKDLIARCGGPSESRAQVGLIHFPRTGERMDEIQLRGEPDLVKKLKKELEKIAATLNDRVVVGIAIPAVQHKALIGRGGQHLIELQNRIGVQIQFPGSRSYDFVGDPENLTQLDGIEVTDLVKVIGPVASCNLAIEELKTRTRPAEGSPVLTHSATVSVPLKYHHTIHQQGNFARQLRIFGVQLEQSCYPPKPSMPMHTHSDNAARIDDTTDRPAVDIQWEVFPSYQAADDGFAEWTLRAREPTGLQKAQNLLSAAIQRAEDASHVGYLSLPTRDAFPRIVGSKGTTVARLRAETGADIAVGKEDNIITIIGQEKAVEAAKAAILRIAAAPNGRRGDVNN